MVTDAEAQRILGYLQQQASEKSIEELVARVKEGAEELHGVARSVPAGGRALIPPGDEWSPEDCLRHVVASNMHVAEQVLHVALTGELSAGTEQGVSGTYEDIISKHEEAIESLFAHVREATPDAFLDVRWKHPFFGDLNWREWLIFLRIHCKDHARQIQAMVSA
jgi:hypothetical protein